MTQEELAQRAGMSARSIGNLEAGRIAAPRPGTVRLLADALELTDDERDGFYRSGTAHTVTRQPARTRPDTTRPGRSATVPGFDHAVCARQQPMIDDAGHRSSADRPSSDVRPLADELFLVGHDRQHGKPLGRTLLPYGLAAAALGELILAGHIDVLGERLIRSERSITPPRSGPGADPVTGYLHRELADPDQCRTATLDEWIRGAAVEVPRRVTQRLAQDHLVIGHRRGRRLRYRRTASGQLVAPEGRITGYLLDQLSPPDAQTRLLIALIDVMDMQGALVLDMTNRELHRRMAPANDLLTPPLRAVTDSVQRVIWRRTLLPRI